mgnify:CR=1 FL=1
MREDVNFSELVGKTIKNITGLEKYSDEVIFECTDGSKYKMYHVQDCCESVEIDEVFGDVNDLIGQKIVLAEANTNSDKPREDYENSFTWTFYKLATQKGYVDIRWYGTSNGYYSEAVDFDYPEILIGVGQGLDFKNGRTYKKQEAVEKMARVICKNRICAIECEKCELWRNFVVLANDCLNALLGE